MGLGKDPGNLRDFKLRNDSDWDLDIDKDDELYLSDDELAFNQAQRKIAAKRKSGAELPRQRVGLRGMLPGAFNEAEEVNPPSRDLKTECPSLNEWASDPRNEDLWEMWDGDEDFRVSSKTPVAAQLRVPVKEEALPRSPAFKRKASGHGKESLEQLAPKGKAPVLRRKTEGQVQASSSAIRPWSVDLALEERRQEKSGTIDYSDTLKRPQLLGIHTREFMAKLREAFAKHLELFNQSRQSAAHTIHLYRVSNTQDDFMLFRNGVKLLVTGERSGKIRFAFNQFLGSVYKTSQDAQFELEALWGPFENLYWTYRGEKVELEEVVRYFLGEFAKQSFR